MLTWSDLGDIAVYNEMDKNEYIYQSQKRWGGRGEGNVVDHEKIVDERKF